MMYLRSVVALLLVASSNAFMVGTPLSFRQRASTAATMEESNDAAPAGEAPVAVATEWSTGNPALDTVYKRISEEVADLKVKEAEAKSKMTDKDSIAYYSAKAVRENAEGRLAAFRANNASAEERAATEKDAEEKKAKADAEKKVATEKRKADMEAKKVEAAKKAEEAKKAKAEAAAAKKEAMAAKKAAATEAAAAKKAAAPEKKKGGFANPFGKK